MRRHADWKHIHHGWWWRGGLGRMSREIVYVLATEIWQTERKKKSVTVTWRGRGDSCHRCGFTQSTTDCFRKSSLPPLMDCLGIWMWETPEWRGDLRLPWSHRFLRQTLTCFSIMKLMLTYHLFWSFLLMMKHYERECDSSRFTRADLLALLSKRSHPVLLLDASPIPHCICDKNSLDVLHYTASRMRIFFVPPTATNARAEGRAQINRCGFFFWPYV